MSDPLAILAVLCFLLALSEWLVRKTWLRHLGTALLVILLTALVANVGVIPTGTQKVPLYDGVFAYLAPLSIFWLLLEVDLRRVWQAGPVLVGLFVIGSVGTAVGVLIGMQLVDGAASIGAEHAAVGAMFTGTYTGGSINFNALALQYEIAREGTLYTASVAADNIITTLWMAVTILVPRLARRRRPGSVQELLEAKGESVVADEGDASHDTQTVSPTEVALLLGLGAAAVFVSRQVGEWFPQVPWILVLTTLALILGHTSLVRRIRGARLLGMVSVYLFLAVIGACCDIGELIQSGGLGVTLLAFAGTVVGVHGVILWIGGRLMKAHPDDVAVASQANVGGGTSALALARSLGRGDLVLPAILLGALGNALGTYLGVLVKGLL